MEPPSLRETATVDAPAGGPRAAGASGRGAHVLAERFELRRALGTGSSGSVFAAYDRALGREIAVKVLHRVAPHAVGRLKSEARALREFSHRNLVTVIDLVAGQGEWCLAMELIVGRPLTEAWRNADASLMLASLAELVDGLSVLHAAGRVHRDLKPENVLVESSGRTVIIDFGLIRTTELDDPDGGFVGTPAYASPEQLSGGPVGPASDWHAVGVMLYEALTGELPERSVGQTRGPGQQVAHRPIALDDPLAAELRKLSAGLMAGDPSERLDGEAIRRVIRRAGLALGAPLTRPAPERMVAREAELRQLGEALRQVESGHATSVSVLGGSGVGKTLLVRTFAAQVLRERRAHIFFSRCHAQEQLPFQSLDPWIEGLVRHIRRLPTGQVKALPVAELPILARLFPSLHQLEALAKAPRQAGSADLHPAALYERAAGVFAALLAALSHQHPLVLVLDDLHDGDADGRMLLELMLSQLRGRVLLLATSREQVRVLTSHVMTERLWLGPLSPEDTKRLVVARLGAVGSRTAVDQLAREAQGHPMFASLLCEQFASAESGALSLSAALSALLARLPPAQRSLLSVLALAGRPLPRALLLSCVADADATCLSILSHRKLVSIGKDRAGNLTYQPYHDQLIEAVQAALTRSDRVALHGALADAHLRLERQEQAPAVRHLLEAGRAHEAAELARSVAQMALQTCALNLAADMLNVALAYGPTSVELDEMGALVFPAVGRHRAAARLFSRRAREAHGEPRFQLQRRAMESCFLAGRYAEGFTRLRALAADLGLHVPRSRPAFFAATVVLSLRSLLFPAPEPVVHASLISERQRRRGQLAWSACAVQLNDLDAWAYFVGVALHETARAGMQHEHALLRLAFYTGTQAAFGLGRRHAEDARARLAQGIEHSPLADWIHASLGIHHLHEGKVSLAAEALEASLEVPTKPGHPTARRFAQAALLVCWFISGHMASVRAHVDDWMREAQHLHDPLLRPVLTIFQALLWLEHDVSRARALIASLSSYPNWRRLGLRHSLWWPAWIELYAGCPEAAYEVARELPWQKTVRVSASDYALGLFVHGQVAAASLDHQPRRMRRLLRAARKLERLTVWVARPFSLLLRAAEAHMSGERERALSLLSAAEDNFLAQELFGFAAAARARRGELTGGFSGQALQRDALTRLEALGFASRDWLRVLCVAMG